MNEISFSRYLQDDVVAPELTHTTTSTSTTTPAAPASSPTTSKTAAPVSTETAGNQGAATTVKPLKDSSVATGAASELESNLEIGDGWGSFTTLLFLVVLAGAGVAFWRFGGVRYLKLCCSGNERARYRRVNSDDLEK